MVTDLGSHNRNYDNITEIVLEVFTEFIVEKLSWQDQDNHVHRLNINIRSVTIDLMSGDYLNETNVITSFTLYYYYVKSLKFSTFFEDLCINYKLQKVVFG